MIIKMSTKNGITTVTKDGNAQKCSSLSAALLNVGIHIGFNFHKKDRRIASEPYPVKCLNPGDFPIRVRAEDLKAFN